MRNVNRKGELFATISLDTLPMKNLYGIGPIEYLKGEIMVLDGTVFSGRVAGKSQKIDSTSALKAPFFVYANVPSFSFEPLPDSITNLSSLEMYLLKKSEGKKRPFPFLLKGNFKYADIHLVNLPDGTKISSPEEAHKGKINYQLRKISGTSLGYFSTEHQGIFTHRTTFQHLHFITDDHQKMGHVDSLTFNPKSIQVGFPTGW